MQTNISKGKVPLIICRQPFISQICCPKAEVLETVQDCMTGCHLSISWLPSSIVPTLVLLLMLLQLLVNLLRHSSTSFVKCVTMLVALSSQDV